MGKDNSFCILCGSSNRSPLYAKDKWQAYKCDVCGLGVLDPRPARGELNKLYTEDYFQSHYNFPPSLISAEMKRRLKQENHRLRFFRKFKKRGNVLDIGCGRGYFLLACRNHGYEVEGIDISADAADYVKLELKIPLHVGELDSIKLKSKSFDIITLWHCLEHTADPNTYLQSAHKWLKDDGILVVDVPNYAGYDAYKYGSKWQQWDLPFHFYHFTPNSIIALLQKNGFAVIHEKKYFSEYVKEKLENAAIPSFLARIFARLYSGGSFAVVAKKH